MKKIIVFIFLCFSFLVNGQRFDGGILAGISASQVDGDSYAGFDKVGLQGGVFVATSFTDTWGAQMEIKYTGKGARKEIQNIEIYKLSLNYIDIPILLTLTFKEKFIGEAGLVPGYLFSASGYLNGEGNVQDFKKFDLSWLLGFRYRLTDNLSLGVRYSYSFISIRNYTNNSSNYGFVANLFGYNTGDYNNYLTFGAYYSFF